jgi:rare lipoprotein A
VVVRINDRGPYGHGRVIDVTPAAAGQLGFSGLTPVSLDIVDR